MSRDRSSKPSHDGSTERAAAHGDVDPLQQARSAVQIAEGLGPLPGVVVAAQQAIDDRSYSAALAATRAWMMHKPLVELLARSMDPNDEDVPRAQALLDRMRPIEAKLPRNIFKLGIAEFDREDEAEWLALVGAPAKRQDKSSAYAGLHGKVEGNSGLADGASVHVGHTSDPILDLSPGDIAKGVLVPPWALVKPLRRRVLGADYNPVMDGVDDVLDGVINDTDYLSGFVVGAFKGTQSAIHDCQNAPIDLIKLIIGELKKFALDKRYDVLVRLRDMIKQAPAALKLLGQRWSDDSDRHAQGEFQGEVVAYIGTQLAILIVTSFAGPLAEAFGPYAGVIRAISAVADPVSVVREVALGVRLSREAEVALQAARNAQRAEAVAADVAQGAAKVEQGAAKVEQGAVRAEQAAGQMLDLADDSSRAGAGMRAGVAAEHDAGAAVPLMQDAVKPLSRTESLLEGLPGDLRGRTRIIESPVLTDSTVQVTYHDGVELVVGAGATPRHVAYHAHTVRMLLRYEGLTGKLRRLIDKALTLLRVRPGYGTAGFEAELEVQKLTAIRDDLQRLLAKADGTLHSGEAIDPAILRAELESVEAQLARHEQALGSFERGRGVVAAEGPDAPVPAGDPAAAAAPRDTLDPHDGQRQPASAEKDAPDGASKPALQPEPEDAPGPIAAHQDAPLAVESGAPLPTRAALDPAMEGPLRAVLERYFPHNKLKRIPKALAGFRQGPYGPALAEAFLDTRLQQCRGFDDIVRRSMNPASHESILAELHRAQLLLDDPAHLGEQIELGIKSRGTLRGDPNHFDIDVGAVARSGDITEGVQSLRAYTTDVRKALYEAMDKGNEQIAAAPARVRRVVVYLQQGDAAAVARFAPALQRYTRETGVIIEAVLPDGTRIISNGAVQ